MKRMTRKQRALKTQMQIRDGAYILLSALILTGIYTKVLLPLGKQVTKTAQADAIKIISPIPSLKPTSTPTPAIIKVQYQDKRIKMLTDYLRQEGSPLADYAAYIVKVSDDNAIDWTLLTAIAGKESGYCQYIPQGSHNCWGLGGSGNMMYFQNYEDAISYEAQLLGSDYRYNAISGIQYKYCPTDDCASNWTADVTMFSHEIATAK